MEAVFPDTIINNLKERFSEQITLDRSTLPAIYLKADAAFLPSIAEHLFEQLNGRFVTCAAIDRRKEKGTFTVLYMFSFDKEKVFLSSALISILRRLLSIPSPPSFREQTGQSGNSMI